MFFFKDNFGIKVDMPLNKENKPNQNIMIVVSMNTDTALLFLSWKLLYSLNECILMSLC